MSTRRDNSGRVGALLNAARTQLWPIPTIFVAASLAAGIAFPRIDERISGYLPFGLKEYLFGGDSGAARDVLSAIAGSMITVSSLTFSLTVVTLQLASSQFSPRLLRTFTRDRQVQVTMGIFLGTFLYSLTVMRTVRDAGENTELFVPALSVSFAYLLVTTSVIALVLFLAHIVRQIRVEAILTDVRGSSMTMVSRVLPEHDPEATPSPVVVPDEAVPLPARATGFIGSIDREALVSAATDAGVIIAIDVAVGAWVVEGTPIAHAWRSDDPAAASRREMRFDELADAVKPAIMLLAERGGREDVTFSLRQLVDVAAKALSPGVNDPTTAVHTINHVSALLCAVARRDLSPEVLRDDDERVRAVIPRRDLAEFVDLGIGQLRSYGISDRLVVEALLVLLRELAWIVREEDRPVVREELDHTRRAIATQEWDQADLTSLHRNLDLVEKALTLRWPPASPTPVGSMRARPSDR